MDNCCFAAQIRQGNSAINVPFYQCAGALIGHVYLMDDTVVSFRLCTQACAHLLCRRRSVWFFPPRRSRRERRPGRTREYHRFGCHTEIFARMLYCKRERKNRDLCSSAGHGQKCRGEVCLPGEDKGVRSGSWHVRPGSEGRARAILARAQCS